MICYTAEKLDYQVYMQILRSMGNYISTVAWGQRYLGISQQAENAEELEHNIDFILQDQDVRQRHHPDEQNRKEECYCYGEDPSDDFDEEQYNIQPLSLDQAISGLLVLYLLGSTYSGLGLVLTSLGDVYVTNYFQLLHSCYFFMIPIVP